MNQPNQRTCLPCTACCEGWLDISEGFIQAHIGQPCMHCKPSGCGIYAERPTDPCRTFYCAWRQDGTPLIDAMRPDLSGVIVVMDRLVWRDQQVIVAIPTGEKIPDESLKYVLGLSTLMGLNVLVVTYDSAKNKFTGNSKLTAYGDAEFAADMKEKFKDGVLVW